MLPDPGGMFNASGPKANYLKNPHRASFIGPIRQELHGSSAEGQSSKKLV